MDNLVVPRICTMGLQWQSPACVVARRRNGQLSILVVGGVPERFVMFKAISPLLYIMHWKSEHGIIARCTQKN